MEPQQSRHFRLTPADSPGNLRLRHALRRSLPYRPDEFGTSSCRDLIGAVSYTRPCINETAIDEQIFITHGRELGERTERRDGIETA